MFIFFHVLTLFLLAAGPVQDAPEEAPKGKIHVVAKETFTATLDLEGTFIPGQADEFVLWPKKYKGGFQVLYVVEPGSPVVKGDVLIRFDTQSIDQQMEKTELDLRTAEEHLKDAMAKKRITEMDMKAERDRTEYELEKAQLSLVAYQNIELPLTAEQVIYQQLFTEHSIADQKDEIEQLGKMYAEDELTEETEEIVLTRSKRNLDRSEIGFELQKRRRDFDVDYREKMELKRRIRDVESKDRALEKLNIRGGTRLALAIIAVEKACRTVDQSKENLEGLAEDRALMEIKSLCDGILLHGSKKLAGGELKRGGMVGSYNPFLTVAKPGSLGFRFSVKEEDLFKVQVGQTAECKPKAKPDLSLAATVDSLAVLPTQGKGWDGTAALEGKQVDFLPGMTGTLSITHKNIEDVVVVPLKAVFQEEGKDYVNCVTDGAKEKKQVTKGDANKKVVIITEGLAEGDRILIENPKNP
jgi:HlyD family secretion protein